MKFRPLLAAAITIMVGCGASSAPTTVKAPVIHYSNGVGGADHVGLTVTKLGETGRFFREVLGFETMREDPLRPVAIPEKRAHHHYTLAS